MCILDCVGDARFAQLVMSRLVSCGRCGKPGRKALCDTCRGVTYGSAEYQANSAKLRAMARAAIDAGIAVFCVICEHRIMSAAEVTVEHIRSVNNGGTNDLANLGPAHRACNYGKRSVYTG